MHCDIPLTPKTFDHRQFTGWNARSFTCFVWRAKAVTKWIDPGNMLDSFPREIEWKLASNVKRRVQRVTNEMISLSRGKNTAKLTCWVAMGSHLFWRTGDSCSYGGDGVLGNHIVPFKASAPPSMMNWSSIQISTLNLEALVLGFYFSGYTTTFPNTNCFDPNHDYYSPLPSSRVLKDSSENALVVLFGREGYKSSSISSS